MRPAFILTLFTIVVAAIGFVAGNEPTSFHSENQPSVRKEKAPVAKTTVAQAVPKSVSKPAEKSVAKPTDKSAPKAPVFSISDLSILVKPADKTAPKATATDPRTNDAETDAIRQTGETFARAYDKGDASAVAAHFTTDAEYIDEQGNVFLGRQAIEKSLTVFFAENPGTRLEVTIDTIRLISSGVAIEDGTTTVMRPAGNSSNDSRYTAVHVKENGKWLTASCREHAPKSRRMHAAQLQQLEWLLGDWVDEHDDAVVTFSCRSVDNGNFLLRQFTVKIAGQEAMSGTQRIGWDPVSGKLRAWIFDSLGGYGEGVWHRDGDSWILRMTGVTADGQTSSGTSIYNFVNDHTMNWQSVDHEVGGVQLPDSELVTIVRTPPAPL